MANNSTKTIGNDKVNFTIGLFIIVFAAWLIWGVLSLLSSVFIASILLAILAFDITNIFRKRIFIKAEDKNKTLVEKIIEGSRKKGKKVNERSTLVFLYLIFTIALAINAVRTVFIASQALNPKYQLAPLNILGFLVVILLLVNLWNALKKISKFAQTQGTKQLEDEILKNYILRVTIGLVEGSYIVGIFLIKFGILH